MRRILTTLTLITFLLGYAPLCIAQRTFTPKIVHYSGNLRLTSVYEEKESSSNTKTKRTTDTVVREDLDLGIGGYIYHPRFIRYIASGSAGLQQEKFTSNTYNSSWVVGSTEKYDVRAMILPYHPYNLELFSSLQTPLLTARVSDSRRTETYQSGAYFRYKERPWSGMLGYVHQETEAIGRRHSNRYISRIGFRKKRFSASARYRHVASSDEDGSASKEDTISLNNSIGYKILHLGSSFSLRENKRDQEKNSLEFNTRQKLWSEILRIDLPWNFKTDFFFSQNRQDDDKTFDTTATFNSELVTVRATEERFRNSDKIKWGLKHELFESLNSQFSASYQDTDSTGGKDRLTNINGGLSYRKKVYADSVFTSRIRAGQSRLVRTGAPLVLEDTGHTADASYEFTLSYKSIDVNTIQIDLIDKVDETTVTLTKGPHWNVVESSPFIKIKITNDPAIFVVNPDDATRYTYNASYSFIPEEFESVTKDAEFTMRLDLWKKLLSTFYTHAQQRTDIEEGSSATEPSQQKSDTYGIAFFKNPYSGRASYKRITSTSEPRKIWVYGLDYKKRLPDDLNLNIGLEHTDEHSLATADDEEEKLRTYQALANVIKKFPRKNLNFNVSGSYIKTEGHRQSSAYTLNSGVTWKVGKAEFNINADHTFSENNNDGNDSEDTSSKILIQMKRKLF